MEGSRLILRIGGNSGIINVNRLEEHFFEDFIGIQDYLYLILSVSYISLIYFIRLLIKGRDRKLILQRPGAINGTRNRSSSITSSSDSDSDIHSEEEYLED